MSFRVFRYILGAILLVEAALLLLPLAVALIYRESPMAFLLTEALLLGIAVPCMVKRPRDIRIYARDGFICVTVGWILISAFGALPFVLDGCIPNYIDALFETVSGFTTTGASILTEVENLPRGILFWRSLTHWLGGMGVLVFMLAILPGTDGQTIHLLRAEVPGPTKGKLVPRIRRTALILYGIYIALTVLEVIALLCTGMPLYDSVANAFATAGTGGFGLKNASIAGYNNPAAEWVIAVFMLLFGINFNIYYYLLIRHYRDVAANEELRLYLLLALGSTAAIAINTMHMFSGVGECLRAAFFQVTSIISTTGFATVNFDMWPAFSKTILVLLTITGACAGSTTGGLKLSRVLLLIKGMVKEVKHVLRPRSVNVVRVDGEAVSTETLHGASSYFAIYALLILISTLLVSVDGFDMTTNFTAALTCVNNVGPGLSLVGPSGNFSAFSHFSKIVLTLDMFLGRLEIMPVLILLSPTAWRRH